MNAVSKWDKWKENMDYENWKYEFKISEVEKTQIKTNPRCVHEVGSLR